MQTKTIYSFNELSEEAQEKALESMRDINVDCSDWHDCVLEDFKTIAEILGVTFDTHTVELYGGGTRQEPEIQYSGFWSQGDGLSFTGTWEYSKGWRKALQDHAPQDKELFEIGYQLQQSAKECGWTPWVRLDRIDHHYSHEQTVTISGSERYDSTGTAHDMHETVEEDILQSLRELMQWGYHQLEREYEYLISDEAIIDIIEANDYHFSENGYLE